MSNSARADEPWRALGGGLEVAEFAAARASLIGDSRITVLRIDPKLARFAMLSSAQGEPAMTAKAWAQKHKLRAVINAGMFGPDLAPLGRMRIAGADINPVWGSQNSLFVFGRDEANKGEKPEARLLDRGCGGTAQRDAAAYRNILQAIRVVDCHGKITWAKQKKQWSMALLGADHAGRILFIHCRSPYPVHELAELLLQLPLDLAGLMYLEGGPEATLYVKAGPVELDKIGSYETGFHEADDNDREWELPNVIGVVKDEPAGE